MEEHCDIEKFEDEANTEVDFEGEVISSLEDLKISRNEKTI